MEPSEFISTQTARIAAAVGLGERQCEQVSQIVLQKYRNNQFGRPSDFIKEAERLAKKIKKKGFA